MEESLTKKWYAVEKYQLDLGQIFPCRFSIYDTCGNVIILCSKYEKMNELNIGGCFHIDILYIQSEAEDVQEEHLAATILYLSLALYCLLYTDVQKQLGGGNAFSFIYI